MVWQGISRNPLDDDIRVRDYLQQRVVNEVLCEDGMDELSTQQFASRLNSLAHLVMYGTGKRLQTLELNVSNLSPEKAALLKQYVEEVAIL
jgi:hypothetical protein